MVEALPNQPTTTTPDLIVDGDNTVNSFVMHSPISWNMMVPLDNMTLPYKFTRMSTSHFMMLWKEVSWTPLA